VLGPALTVGATVVLLPSFEKQGVLDAIHHESITHLFAVPSVFRLLIDASIPPKALQSVRRYVSAGAPLPVSTQEEWTAEFDMPIDVAYGLTETSPFATYDRAAGRIGSVGKPVEGVEIQVMDNDGTAVLPGSIGEIAVKGPNVMLGYWRRPEETAAAIRDGWFRTGDLGRLSDDGYVYLVDRANDMMIFDGQNVYPSEVERVLTEHPAVSEAVTYGTPHPLVGDLVRAVVVLQPGAAVTETDLQVLCAQRLATYKVPRTIRLAEQITRNASPARN
jgi:long-chain acyl-CoA synthetase